MNDWVVIVKHRAEPTRQRIFVEDVQYEDEAKRLALLKLGVSTLTHEASVDLIDERVSVKDPMYNSKELLKKALADLVEVRREHQEEQIRSAQNLRRAERAEAERDVIDLVEARKLKASISDERHRWQVRAERAEAERDRLARTNILMLTDLALVDSTIDQILKRLES